MKFTIVMPVLDSPEFFEAAIQSVQNQTHQDWELLIVDGGSADPTLNIARHYTGADSRISLLSQGSKGIYGAIFEGFDASSGEMFCWLNSDDLYPPWALSAAAALFQNKPDTSWLMGMPGVWDKSGNLRYILPITYWPRSFIRKGYFHPDFLGCIQAESTFFRASLFEKVSKNTRDTIVQTKLAGDYFLWRALAEHAPLVSVPTLLGGFRIHGRNRSIVEMSDYMAEIRALGAPRLPLRISRYLGRLFQIFAMCVSYKKAQKSSIEINQEV